MADKELKVEFISRYDRVVVGSTYFGVTWNNGEPVATSINTDAGAGTPIEELRVFLSWVDSLPRVKG